MSSTRGATRTKMRERAYPGRGSGLERDDFRSIQPPLPFVSSSHRVAPQERSEMAYRETGTARNSASIRALDTLLRRYSVSLGTNG